MAAKQTKIKTVKKEKPLQLKRFQSFSNLEKKYCSCLMKVRGRDYKLSKKNFKLPLNPHGICTNALYNRRGLKRTKVVKCSKLYMFNKYPKQYIVAYAVEKDIPVYNVNGKVLTKNEIVKKIEQVLDSEYKRTRLRKHMKHYKQEGGKFKLLKLFELLNKEYYNIMEIFNHKNLTPKELNRIRKNAKQMHYKMIKYHVYTKTRKGDTKVKIVTEKIR